MPNHPSIPAIRIIGAGPLSLAPFRGRGWPSVARSGEGGVCWGMGHGTVTLAALRSGPLSPLSFAESPSPPEGGEGSKILAQDDQDGSCYAFGVRKHVAVREADDAVAFGRHERGAGGVLGFATGVAVAVEFDDQAVLAGGEVGDIGRAEDYLPDELDVLQPTGAKDCPERVFGRGHFGAQGFGAGSVFGVSFRHLHFPLSPLAVGESPSPPEGGEGFSEYIHA